MKLKVALLVSLLFILPATAEKLGVCDLLLAGPKGDTKFAFQVSDVETLYLELLQDSVRISNGDEKYVKDNAENYMKKKAEFLNDATSVIRQLRARKKLNDTAKTELELMFTMVSTLGASVDTMKAITKPYRPKKGAVETPPPEKNPIGFLDHGNDDGSGPSPHVGFGNNLRNTGTDLPEGMRRSIGFGPQVVESRVETPSRAPGKMLLELTEDGNTIVVSDLMTDIVYMIKKEFMFAGDAESEFKSFAIDYDPSEHEWILRYVNLANPEGKIGFQF